MLYTEDEGRGCEKRIVPMSVLFCRICYPYPFTKDIIEEENMVRRIYHVGLTVSDLERSIAFYRDILGLEFQGEIFMEGEETDKMFRKENCKARVAYLNGSKLLKRHQSN